MDMISEILTILLSLALIAGILAIIAAVLCIPIRNAVQRSRMTVAEAFSDVEVALCKRYDVTVQLFNILKGFMSHERKTLLDVTAMRRGGKTVEELEKSSKQIDEMLGKLLVTAEAFPQLRSSELFLKLMETVDSCENNISAARRLYNSNASLFNSSRHEFPTCLFAAKYPSYDLFQCDSHKRDLPTISF